jgi:hypothetical protein
MIFVLFLISGERKSVHVRMVVRDTVQKKDTKDRYPY